MEKTERPCTECGKKFKAISGHVCDECWIPFQDKSPEWQEFWRVFPWARKFTRGE